MVDKPEIQDTAVDDLTPLVAKHRMEIDKVLAMDGPQQQDAVRALGLDPKAIMQNCKDLVERDKTLQKLDDAARSKRSVVGWVSAAAGAAAAYLSREKFSKGNALLQTVFVTLTGTASGLAGGFLGAQLLNGHIRRDAGALAIESRAALERELAVQLENKTLQDNAHAANNAPITPLANPAPGDSPANSSPDAVAMARSIASDAAPAQTPPAAMTPDVARRITARDSSYAAQAKANAKSANAAAIG